MKVLIADSDVVIRQQLSKSLLGIGISLVSQASSTKQLIKMLYRESFDLVLIGWKLSSDGSSDIIREIRSKGNNVPMISLLENPGREEILEVINAGVNNYITYPIDEAQFKEKVSLVFKRHLGKKLQNKTPEHVKKD